MENITYEQAMKKLEKLVAKLEKGDLPLEDTVKLYDDATKLTGYCSALLNNAEAKITELSASKE